MAVPYTVRLGGGSSGPGPQVVLFTPIDGYAWVLRDIVVYAAAIGTSNVWISIVPPGGGELPLWIAALSSYGTAHLDLRQRIEPGEVVIGHCAESAWSCFLTGYQLTLP